MDGTRTLLCGAQALGMADLGPPEWDEEYFDYKTKQGINNALNKEFKDSKRTSEIYSSIKPLIADKKGK